MPCEKKRRYGTGAGLLCAGLLYALVLIPRGLRLPCLFYRATGLRCPGCGITDACLALLHGRIGEAMRCNWGLTAALPVLGWLSVRCWQGKGCGRTERRASALLLALVLAWGAARNIWGV